jgi:ATP-dependent helicase Lhr and Lhr-like helicase
LENAMKNGFHPLVWRWFKQHFEKPTVPQENGWAAIAGGRSTLIAAPTGSGKTLAAFLWSIDRLFQRALCGQLDDTTSVVYVSPLKALGNDIARNLKQPLAEIFQLAWSEGLLVPELRVAVRSGDTPASERQSMVRTPPHILITTPESLYILLTAERSRRFLKTAETVIVDEIHAVAQDKRGAHLSLSLERLEALAQRPLQRIGLSATQRPIEDVARLLVGHERLLSDGRPDCEIVDAGHQRDMDLQLELPDQDLGAIATHEMWAEVYEKVVAQVKAHRTTLVFVNTRRFVERVAHQLSERLGEDKVGAHHGSLSRKIRLQVEEKLKSGALPVVVATASLELGIDIGHVDLVCHIGAPRTISILLQRVGRSGHWLGALPKGVLYPLTRDDLVQCVAGIRAVREGELDRLKIPEKPLDILAQQMVATIASADAGGKSKGQADDEAGTGISEASLWQLVRRSYSYRNLTHGEFEKVLHMLSEGISTRRGRRSAFVHRDRVHHMLRARRGARLAAITNGGAIPDTADYDVVQFPDETLVGKVNEDFAIESLAGDIFLLGNRSWRIRRVGSGKVWVEDAQGLPPSIPFWFGEAPARTRELSAAVSDLRLAVSERLDDPGAALRWLSEETGITNAVAEQIVNYVKETKAVLGCIPGQAQIVAERFFDEAGGMQLVIHSPWGNGINRAWGLALRKRFCVNFDRELQAAATDDGIVISLVEQHSFPTADVFSMLRPAIVERELTQAVLASPFFTNRWRWNATRALAVARHSGGKKVPVALQRMRAEDLLSAVFPEQTMCQDNRVGPVEIPDHPLVTETLHDCLHEAMDLAGLREILGKIDGEEIRTVAVDTPAPSPMAHEILNANPYAFLDDAPLEERRARAVSLRRVDPRLDGEWGRLDGAAIREVCDQAWPALRDADELHDLMLSVCVLPVEEQKIGSQLAQRLIDNGRATCVSWLAEPSGAQHQAYVPAERLALARLALPPSIAAPEVHLPDALMEAPASEEEATRRIVQGWIEILGPTTVSQLSRRLGIRAAKIEAALLALESSGIVMRGDFTAANRDEIEWCDRVLLARIHRLTLGRMRKEIEPVSPPDFIKFLFAWQHVSEQTQLRGRDGVLAVIRQLQGLELPAPAWEQYVLPARVKDYDPSDLEDLCLAGVVAWGRLRMNDELPEANTDSKLKQRRRRLVPTRTAPIAFLLRDELEFFLEGAVPAWEDAAGLSHMAREVGRYLAQRGASFLADIARGTGLLKVKTEEALWQLVAHGFATGDGIAGLRVLLTPETKRAGRRRGLRVISGGRAAERMMPVGRWSLWRERTHMIPVETEKLVEHRARQLLCRYGVVFRDLLAREFCAPSWRSLLAAYRRLEARGEIRGGRFINGFVGEQFALPEAVDRLRAQRRSKDSQDPVVISSADPLNLVGILTPGSRLSPYSNQVVAYQGGMPIDVGLLGAVLSRLQQQKNWRGGVLE